MYFQEDHIVTIKLCYQIFSFLVSRIGYNWDMNAEEGELHEYIDEQVLGQCSEKRKIDCCSHEIWF